MAQRSHSGRRKARVVVVVVVVEEDLFVFNEPAVKAGRITTQWD